MTGYSKLVAYVIGGALLTLAVFLFLVKPTLNKVAELTREEYSTRAEIQRLEQQILAYRTAQSDLSKAISKDLLYSAVVDDKNLFVPIEEMEAAAKRTGTKYLLKINRNSLDDEQENAARKGESGEAPKVTGQTELEEVPYTLSVQNANYQDLIAFFQYLEHIPHYTEISGIDLSMEEDDLTQKLELTAIINGVFLAKKNELKVAP